MNLALEARLYKWVCYRCAHEVFSPTNATCPDCAFPLVIECDESPSPSLWQDDLVHAQRALRVPTPLLIVPVADMYHDEEATGDLPPPPEIVRTVSPAIVPPASPAPRAIDAAVPIRSVLLTFAGVAVATFVVAWAVAAAIQFGF